MKAAEFITSSERGVACPHCGHEHCSADLLALLVPGHTVEWDCDHCDRQMAVTKILPAPVYLAERIGDGLASDAR